MSEQPITNAQDISGHYACPPMTAGKRWWRIAPGLIFAGATLIAAWQLPKAAFMWSLLALFSLYLCCMEWRVWQRQRRAMHNAIDADQDGLWLSASGKDIGLVRWDAMAALRERNGELEVLDAQGRRLLGVSLYLDGMQRLAQYLWLNVPVAERATVFRPGIGGLLQGGLGGTSTVVVLFPAVVFASSNMSNWLVTSIMLPLGFGACLLAILWLCNTLYRVDVLPDGVKLYMPLRRRFIRWADVRGIHLGGGESLSTPYTLLYPAILLEVLPGTPGTNSESLQLLPPQLRENNPVSVPINGFGRVPAALLQALYLGWENAAR